MLKIHHLNEKIIKNFDLNQNKKTFIMLAPIKTNENSSEIKFEGPSKVKVKLDLPLNVHQKELSTKYL